MKKITQKKKGRGQPTKYDPAICNKFPGLMAEGQAIEEVAVELGVCLRTINNWEKKYPEFLQALKKGRDASYAWWLREGRVSLRDKDFNYTGWYMQMKNRHGWTDKREDTLKGKIQIEVVYKKTNITSHDDD